MAITENRGGANGGPQYSPLNVNPFGGDGQSGNIDYTGFSYGMNKQINEQRRAESIKTPSPRAFPEPDVSSAPIVTLDSAPLNPNLPVTAGGRLGGGPGEEALMLPAVVPGMEIDSGTNALRAMYMQDPNNQDLRRMIEYIDTTGVPL